MVGESAEPLSQVVQLVVQRFWQMTAQPGVIRRHAFNLFFPARNVHREQLLEAVGGQIQAVKSSASAVGRFPMGVFCALPVPSTRSQIHLSTRLFSP